MKRHILFLVFLFVLMVSISSCETGSRYIFNSVKDKICDGDGPPGLCKDKTHKHEDDDSTAVEDSLGEE